MSKECSPQHPKGTLGSGGNVARASSDAQSFCKAVAVAYISGPRDALGSFQSRAAAICGVESGSICSPTESVFTESLLVGCSTTAGGDI